MLPTGLALDDDWLLVAETGINAVGVIDTAAGKLLGHLPAGGVLIAYDERGRSDLTSEQIADRIGGWRDAGRAALCVAIGGPDGHDASIRTRAELILSFGAATLPHGLVRVLVLEQLYRSMTILAGHPYHRGEAGA